MASTNSYDFVLTRDQLIGLAHQQIGVVGEGESPTSAQVTEAALLLNMITKLRAADGMPLWALKRGTILPKSSVSSIDSNSHVVTFYDSTYLSAAAAASATSLTIAAAGTIANSDQVGIELTSGDMHWTTVSSGGGTTTLVIATGLASAAAANSRVYAYTASADRIQRPLRVIEGDVLDIVNSYSWPINLISRDEYYSFSSRASEGAPNSLYYEPTLGSAVADPATSTTWYGTFYFYPRFQDGKKVIEFTYHRPFQDFDAASDHPDFPQEFYLPLMLELAALLGPKFGVEKEERAALHAEAKMYREEALSTIHPEGSLSIEPEIR